jgi:hypothetical protein
MNAKSFVFGFEMIRSLSSQLRGFGGRAFRRGRPANAAARRRRREQLEMLELVDALLRARSREAKICELCRSEIASAEHRMPA